MKYFNAKRNRTAVLLAAVLTLSLLAGCAGTPDAPTGPASGIDATLPAPWDGTLHFYPAEKGLPAMDTYEFPYMGMTAAYPEALLEQVGSRDVLVLPSAEYQPGDIFDYAAMCWYALDESQKELSVRDINDLVPELARIGVLGVYRDEASLDLDKLTGCTEHLELGKSPDGAYTYMLSLSDEAGAERKDALSQVAVTISPMEKMDLYRGLNAFSEKRVDAANVGTFQTVDINGNAYTEAVFADYDLTLVNVFTTWCPACVEEMPELEVLRAEMADRGVNVIGIAYDTVNMAGEPQEDIVELVRRLQEQAAITFPLLIPDEGGMNGRLKGISAYPESFFVDRDGNIVGETYVGARTLESWRDIVEQELAALQAG